MLAQARLPGPERPDRATVHAHTDARTRARSRPRLLFYNYKHFAKLKQIKLPKPLSSPYPKAVRAGAHGKHAEKERTGVGNDAATYTTTLLSCLCALHTSLLYYV